MWSNVRRTHAERNQEYSDVLCTILSAGPNIIHIRRHDNGSRVTLHVDNLLNNKDYIRSLVPGVTTVLKIKRTP